MSRRRQKKKSNEDESTDDEEDIVISDASESNDDEEERPWLDSLIREELEPTPVKNLKSKEPIKKAKQLYPFQCSECSAKYKTQIGFEKHLRSKHGLQ